MFINNYVERMITMKNEEYLNKKKNRIIIFGLLFIIVILTFLLIMLLYARKNTIKNELAYSNSQKVKDTVKVLTFEYDNKKHDVPPKKSDNYVVDYISCDNATAEWDNDLWQLKISNIFGNIKCDIIFKKKYKNNNFVAINKKKSNITNDLIDSNNDSAEKDEEINVNKTIKKNNYVKNTANDEKAYSSNVNIKKISSSCCNIEMRENEYFAIVDSYINNISFNVDLEDDKASIFMNDSYNLDYGLNSIKLLILAEDAITEKVINVYIYRKRNIEKIELKSNYYLMDKNQNQIVEYTLVPYNTDYKDLLFISNDENIARVSDNGIISTINYGKTYINVLSKYDSSIVNKVLVDVKNLLFKNNNYKIISNVDLSKKYITGFEPKTTIENIMATFDNDFDSIKIFDKNENEITNYNESIKTGMIFKLMVDDILKDELIAILHGDVNRDGVINVMDYKKINNYINKVVEFDYNEFLAADVDENNDIDQIDYNTVYEYVIKKISSVNISK